MTPHEKLIRVYQKNDPKAVNEHLLIYGDVSGQCGHCNALDVKLEMNFCPSCKTEFLYVAFRNIKFHLPKVTKLFAQRPSLKIIDYDDHKRNLGELKAEEFLK
ncbi:MAG: hypothetical protein HQL23_01675 [Candidatus Omnitrophica bacterium]|nr:hypothetical protein [Candidatus Omnitrophota bacterium]